METSKQVLLRWRRFKDKLEAIYTQHEERQKERVRAIKSQAGQSSMAERVKQVRPQTTFVLPLLYSSVQ